MSTPGSQSALRATNQRRVIEHVLRAGSPTQAEISRATGLSAATVSNIVHDLTDRGTVELSDTVSSGRRARAVRLSSRAGLAAGVDFGRSHVRLALAGLSQEVLAESEVSVARGYAAAEGVDVAHRLFLELVESLGASPSDVSGLGVGIPGPIDSVTGRVGSGSILPEWVGEPLRDLVHSRFALPTVVDNDANLGALAEWSWGAARGVRDLVYIKVSTGIGAGIVADGRLYRGASGTAGEIGHITVDPSGPSCRCGNRGCLEMDASVPMVLERVSASHGKAITLDRVVELLAAGDVPAHRAVQGAGQSIGLAVAGLFNLLNPAMVVIGGELARAGDVLLDSIGDVVRRVAVPSAVANARIVSSELGGRAQALGALAVVFQNDEHIGRVIDDFAFKA